MLVRFSFESPVPFLSFTFLPLFCTLPVWIHLYKSDRKVPNLKGGGTDPFTNRISCVSILVQYNFQLRRSGTVTLRSLLTLLAMV